MLAYASSRPRAVERKPAPNAMLAIIAGHVALLAGVMSAKMDLPQRIADAPTIVDFIHEDDPPPPVQPTPDVPQRPAPAPFAPPEALVPTPPLPAPDLDVRPVPLPQPGPAVIPTPGPMADPLPNGDPVRVSARLNTPASELRPPYPASKLASGEEAVLKLRLSIDERGRVIAVEPGAPADRAFLDAARRHILARWRYKPATEGGRPVATSLVVTLRFELES